MPGSRYSSASPLEREVLMNNLNAYKNNRSHDSNLGDIKSKLLGKGDARTSEYSSDNRFKSNLLSDYQLSTSPVQDPGNAKSPLIEEYHSKSSKLSSLHGNKKLSSVLDDTERKSLLIEDSKVEKLSSDRYRKLSSDFDPKRGHLTSLEDSTERKKSPRLSTSETPSGRRLSRLDDHQKSQVRSDVKRTSTLSTEERLDLGQEEYSPKLSRTSDLGSSSKLDDDFGDKYRKLSFSTDKYAPHKMSPLLTDATPTRSMEEFLRRKSLLRADDNSGEEERYRLSSSSRKQSLYSPELDAPSSLIRDLKPPVLNERSSYGALNGNLSSRSQYSDYLGSRTHLDSSKSDVSSIGRRSPLLKDSKFRSAASSELLDQEEDMKVPLKEVKKKRKRRNPVTVNLSGTRYDIVRQMVEQIGFTVTREEDPNAYLIWNDSFVSTERISELKPFQRINHFPGMGEICRKDCLARNMAKIAKIHPDEFNFVPKTWILPSEYSAFQTYARELRKKKKSKTFIAKPANGAMGNGISLYRNAERIPQNDHMIVQEYIDKPLLIEGFKCDMRIYVLVTCCDPLRIFLYNDGLLRMGTEKYVFPTEANIDHLFMHLTNYSVNKHNEQYEKSHTVDTGSKRSLKYFNDYLRKNDYDVAFLWKNITDMLVKTLIVALPHMLHAYRMCRPGQSPGSDSVCFELLGFDVMLDKKLRPWLIEINRSPSFGTDEKLDYDIKSHLIEHTLKLLNIKASDKRKNIAAQKAQTQRRLLRPTKRVDNDMSELDKKRQSVERKKEELKDLLTRIRKDAAREDFENRNCGNFKRIFPPDDKFKREKYASLITDAFNIFLSGRAASLQQEIKRAYSNKYKEEDILDMLAQCEADEKEGIAITSNRPPRGPKPLQSMPTLSRENLSMDDEDEDEDFEGSGRSPSCSPGTQRRGPRSRSSNSWTARSHSGRPGSSKTSASHRSRSLNRIINAKPTVTEETLLMVSQREKEEEMTKSTLVALNDMRIKFPGKTDEEADYILDKLHEDWKFHKPRIASYWLVKLDSIKRRKVIDIVRSNVRALMQRTWKSSDIDTLRLYRIFTRVFNRLLWSHGQGLWNCFQTSGNSWETIFSKSTDSVSPSEMACCRRIVQLCRDCLLIVYKFAAEAKNAGHQVTQESYETSNTHIIRH